VSDIRLSTQNHFVWGLICDKHSHNMENGCEVKHTARIFICFNMFFETQSVFNVSDLVKI